MSHYPPVDPKSIAPRPPEEANGFGLAAFVVSIGSLFLCGIPAMIGILLSLIGLRRKPRGLAMAGLVISTVALGEMLALGLGTYSVYTGYQAWPKEKNVIKLYFNPESGSHGPLMRETIKIGWFWKRNGTLPDKAAGQALVAGSLDDYGAQLVYETDDVSFSVRSSGPDGELNTADDSVYGPFSTSEEALEYDQQYRHAKSLLLSARERGSLDPEVLQQLEDSFALTAEIEKEILARSALVLSGEQLPRIIFGKQIEMEWRGEVVRVIDGETIEVLQGRDTPITIRLESIDCPESTQPFSENAKSFVSEFCLGEEVTVFETGKDRYGNRLAFVNRYRFFGRPNVSSRLISEGLAWHDKEHSDSETLAELEQEAKEARRGLWGGTGPDDQVPPWEWLSR